MFRYQSFNERVSQAKQENVRPVGFLRPALGCKDRCHRLPENTKDQRRQRNNCFVNCKNGKQTKVWNMPLRQSQRHEEMGVDSKRRSSKRSSPRRSTKRSSPRRSAKKSSPKRSSPRRSMKSVRMVDRKSPLARGISVGECKSRCRDLPSNTKSQRREKNNCYVNCKK
tara:strand:- start:19 stop:522 length:504 start_codon:yes stop_codon:yes gene_type:complete